MPMDVWWQWMFGGIERGTRQCFLKLVERSDAGTLLLIIEQFILPGSVIMSDLWAAYGGIDQLPQYCQHLTVNHTYDFVNPGTGAHTQNVENMWGCYKKKIKKSNGLNTRDNERYTDYLQEFMWREKFPIQSEVMLHFRRQVAEFYPCEH